MRRKNRKNKEEGREGRKWNEREDTREVERGRKKDYERLKEKKQ